MSFIDEFIDFTRHEESPENFWRWAAYATIAALLRDSVYYDHGLRKTYPNIYVVFLAQSANDRKSGPFNIVYSLLQHQAIANTKLIRGRASVQAILDELSSDVGSKNGGLPMKGGSCLLAAEELASFFVNDPQLIAMLTDMYDFRELWEYKLRSTGSMKIKNLCVTLLAASNEQLLKEVYTDAAIYGGLLGRTFMVRPDAKRPPNAQVDVDPNMYKPDQLIKTLKEIKTQMRGPIKMDIDAKNFYVKWYDNLYNSYKKYNDRTGMIQRIHTGVIKLAIILAAADCKMEIAKSHVEEAIVQATALKTNYDGFVLKSGKSAQAQSGALLLEMIKDRGGQVARKEFLMFHWNDVSAEELDKVIITFENAGLVTTIVAGNEISYSWTTKLKNVLLKTI